MTATSVIVGAVLLTVTARLFWHLRRLTPATWDGEHPRTTRRWSGQLLRLVGRWQIVTAAVIGVTPEQQLGDWLSLGLPLIGMGAMLALAGQAKSPTVTYSWLAQHWRPARILLLLGA